MKKISIILLAIVASCTVTNCSAQLLGKWKKKLNDKLEQKADEIIDRVENKAENKVDETLDRTEERITGNGQNNTPRRRGGRGGGILGRVDPPQATYNFTHFVKMRTKTTGRRARNNSTTTARLDYGTSPDVISISNMIIDGNRNDEMKDMDRVIMDIDQSALYTFMRIEDRKARIGIKFNMVDVAEELQKPGSEYKVLSVTKTGQSKTVAGYKADAYLCKSAESETTLWISRANGLNPYPDFYNAMSSRRGGNRGMAMFYNSEIVKARMDAGAMMLSYEYTNPRKGDKVEMNVTSFGKARSSFNTTPYKSLTGQ